MDRHIAAVATMTAMGFCESARVIELRSDNAAGVCPQVAAALSATNVGSALGYGGDSVTGALRERVRDVFESPDADIFPTVTGTAANAVGLSALCPPWGAVLCHDTAHIAVHEGGATSHLSGGAVLRQLAGPDGRIDVAVLERAFDETWWDDPHQSQPAVLSIVCPSDLGTVPTVAQVRELTDRARARGLRCHMDGARFANAVATLGCAPAELTWRSGIDVLSFGATKNGGLTADAIVSFDPAVSDQLRFRLKRSGHVPSKMRFQSAQLLAMLTDGLWLENARHANQMAQRLATGLQTVGHQPLHPVDANMIFLEWNRQQVSQLGAAGLAFYELRPGLSRLVTSWQTTADEVDRAVQLIGQVGIGG